MRIKLSPWTLWTLAVLLGVALSASWSGLNMGLARTDPPAVAPSMVKAGDSVQVLYLGFTPPVGVAKNIVQAIDQAKQEVLVQAYGFTHNAIAQALVRAHQRGAKVQVLLDEKSDATNRYVIGLLHAAGIPIRLDGAHAIAHNKVMVLDGQVVVTGSFNFTNAAETRNAENLLILRSPALAQAYRDNWLQHLQHARP